MNRLKTVKSVGGVSLPALATVLVSTLPANAQQSEIAALRQQIMDMTERLNKMEADSKKTADDKAKAAAGVQLKWSGYVQGEYRRQTGEGRAAVNDFDVRRARIKLDAIINKNISLTIQPDFGGTTGAVTLRDAYMDIGNQRGKLRFGQFKVPLSYQIVESSANRLTPERALINTRSVPGERDRGVMLEAAIPGFELGGAATLVQLGLFNGRGINTGDNNSDKDIVAALAFPAKPLSGRIAYLRGDYLNPSFAPPAPAPAVPGGNVRKQRISADLQYDKAPWNLQAQYAIGRGDFISQTNASTAANLFPQVTNAKVKGGYAQIAYGFPKGFTLVGRYQSYDPNTATGGNTISGPLLGLVYDPNKSVRYLLAVEQLNNFLAAGAAGSRTLITARTQVRF